MGGGVTPDPPSENKNLTVKYDPSGLFPTDLSWIRVTDESKLYPDSDVLVPSTGITLSVTPDATILVTAQEDLTDFLHFSHFSSDDPELFLFDRYYPFLRGYSDQPMTSFKMPNHDIEVTGHFAEAICDRIIFEFGGAKGDGDGYYTFKFGFTLEGFYFNESDKNEGKQIMFMVDTANNAENTSLNKPSDGLILKNINNSPIIGFYGAGLNCSPEALETLPYTNGICFKPFFFRSNTNALTGKIKTKALGYRLRVLNTPLYSNNETSMFYTWGTNDWDIKDPDDFYEVIPNGAYDTKIDEYNYHEFQWKEPHYIDEVRVRFKSDFAEQIKKEGFQHFPDVNAKWNS